MIKKVYARYVSHTATPIYKVGCEFDGEERLVMLEGRRSTSPRPTFCSRRHSRIPSRIGPGARGVTLTLRAGAAVGVAVVAIGFGSFPRRARFFREGG